VTHDTSQLNTYKIYQGYEMDIKSLRTKILTTERALNTWVTRQGPGMVSSVNYDGIPGASIIIPVDVVMDNIIRLTAQLQGERSELAIIEDGFSALKKQIRRTAAELGDLEYKVFVAGWIDGKRILEIAQECGYSIPHIKTVKRHIYEKMLDPAS